MDSGNNVTSARSDKNVTFLKFFLGSWKTNKRDKARDLENLIIFLCNRKSLNRGHVQLIGERRLWDPNYAHYSPQYGGDVLFENVSRAKVL